MQKCHCCTVRLRIQRIGEMFQLNIPLAMQIIVQSLQNLNYRQAAIDIG